MGDDAAKPQHTGIIKWFDRKKGFGFLAPETGGDDIFIHQLNIGNNSEGKRPFLDEGDTIYYDMGDHNGRPTATNVKLPPGKGLGVEKRRRSRGRNAKKELDDEADDLEAEDEKEGDAATGAAKPEGGGKGKGRGKGEGGGKGKGGRGGGERRNEFAANRPKRNDKGVGGKPEKGGSKSTGSKAASAGVDPAADTLDDTTES